MDPEAMAVADKMPLIEGNQNILHEEIPMIISGDKNFHGGVPSSSIGQASSMNEEFAPITVDVSPDMFEDKLPESPIEDHGNNGAENEDAHSENEHPDEQPTNGNPKKRKQYQRHTHYQIQGMEAFFKQYPHPDDKQRRELGQELGLDHLQVKFWFQNKRTQMKTQHERKENNQLRGENEKLRCENIKLKQSIPVSACKQCGNTCAVALPLGEHHLRLENARLKEKIEHVKAIAKDVFGNGSKALASSCTLSSSLNQGSLEFGRQLDNIPSGGIICGSQSFRPLDGLSELDKSLVIELAISAMEEVATLARIGEPIWIPNFERNTFVLNEQEYLKTFRTGFAPKLVGFKSEASRECMVVIMNPFNILEIFMELNKWLAVFSGMVSKAMLLELVSTGAEGIYNGALQVMSAEFQVLSPAVPTRDCVFARYCKQLSEGTWAVVDVSVDAVLPKGLMARCQRRPSGCIIQAMPNGCSKITWVEHVEVQDHIIHSISRSIISSGDAYSAKRWISILRRQCERLASAMGIKDYPYHEDLSEIVLAHPEGRQNVLKLAERMVLCFCGGVTASSGAYHWTTVSGNGADEVRIMTRKSVDDPGRPRGLVLSASISFWIPVLPKTVFDYFRNERTRAEWDILCIGGGAKEIAYIGNGQETGNCVTVLRVTNPSANQGNMLILQESSSEPTASFIVYAPVDIVSANMLFRGGNPENVQLLPSGFTILPSGPPRREGGIDDANTIGTLLSVAYQILVDSDPYAKLSVATVATVNNLIESAMEKIKTALRVDYSSNERLEKSLMNP